MTFKTDSIYNYNEGAKLIRAELLKIVDEQIFEAGLDPVQDKLGYVIETVEIPDWVFTSMLGTHWLDEIGETDDFPVFWLEQGYEKGYRLKRFANRIPITKPLRKWIENSTKSAKLDGTVKVELAKLARNTDRLVRAAKITRNELSLEVLTKGFSVTAAYWPWSAYPDGQPLFSANHVIKATWEIQSNLVTGALTQLKLEEAISKLRNMKDGIGRTMKLASTYTLIVPTSLEATARKILNDGSKFAAAVSDVAVGNDVTSSIFQWDGFRIELLVIDGLNQPKKDGTKVGTATNWFVINKDAVRNYEAFKTIVLFNEEMDMYEDKASKVMYVDIDLSLNSDFYNYECVCGSEWV